MLLLCFDLLCTVSTKVWNWLLLKTNQILKAFQHTLRSSGFTPNILLKLPTNSGWQRREARSSVFLGRSCGMAYGNYLNFSYTLKSNPGELENVCLKSAFLFDGVNNRVIIASPDVRAVTRYLKSGVKIRFSIYDWGRKPEIVPFETDLAIEPFGASPENLTILNAIDRTILGYTREVDHIWLSQNRYGHFYRAAEKSSVIVT